MPVPHHLENRTTLGLDLIRCRRQPGNLHITRHACALRYLLSRKTASVPPTNEFEMARKLGLDKCRSCPLGRLYAKGVTVQKC